MRKKKGKKLITALIIIVLIFAIGFAGFKLLQMLTNLGVKVSETAYLEALDKLGYEKDTAPTEGSFADYEYIYGPPVFADAYFTSEEASSFMSHNRPSYYPFKKTRVKANTDDTLEMSSTVSINEMIKSFTGNDAEMEEVMEQIPFLSKIPGKITVRIKIKIKIIDNEVEYLEIISFKVFGVKVPEKLFKSDEVIEQIKEVIEEILKMETEKNGTTVDHFEVTDGKIHYKGNIPSSLTRVKKKG